MSASYSERPVLFFDGLCNLCNSSVQYIIRHDKRQRFLFASLQSVAGRKALTELKAKNGRIPDSLLLYYKGKYYTESGAALRAAALLNGLLPLLSVFLIIPPFIRNVIYRFIARNRYKWFGERAECMIPTSELKGRFLE